MRQWFCFSHGSSQVEGVAARGVAGGIGLPMEMLMGANSSVVSTIDDLVVDTIVGVLEVNRRARMWHFDCGQCQIVWDGQEDVVAANRYAVPSIDDVRVAFNCCGRCFCAPEVCGARRRCT